MAIPNNRVPGAGRKNTNVLTAEPDRNGSQGRTWRGSPWPQWSPIAFSLQKALPPHPSRASMWVIHPGTPTAWNVSTSGAFRTSRWPSARDWERCPRKGKLWQLHFEPNHSFGRLGSASSRKRLISTIFPCSGIFLWGGSAKPHGSTTFLHAKPSCRPALKSLLGLSSNPSHESHKFLS